MICVERYVYIYTYMFVSIYIYIDIIYTYEYIYIDIDSFISEVSHGTLPVSDPRFQAFLCLPLDHTCDSEIVTDPWEDPQGDAWIHWDLLRFMVDITY